MTQLIDTRPHTAEEFERFGEGALPGLLGLELEAVEHGRVASRLEVAPRHMAPNGRPLALFRCTQILLQASNR